MINNRQFKQIRKDLRRLHNIARHLVREIEGLSEMIESVNPSNQIRKRKAPTMEELTQIELEEILRK